MMRLARLLWFLPATRGWVRDELYHEGDTVIRALNGIGASSAEGWAQLARRTQDLERRLADCEYEIYRLELQLRNR